MKRPSPSWIEIPIECPASAALEPVLEDVGAPAIRGTNLHEFLAACMTKPREQAIDLMEPAYRQAALDIDLSGLPVNPRGFVAELAVAYDVAKQTAREISRGKHGRNYGELAPFELAGTMDVCGLGDDFVYVGDFKTGWADDLPAGDDWQLRSYAVAAAALFDKPRALVEKIHLRDDGSHWRSRYEFTELDLLEFATELRKTYERVSIARKIVAQGGQPPVKVGRHCTYCPALRRCPGQMALVNGFASKPETLDPERLPALNEARAAELWERLDLLEKLIPIARGGLQEFAKSRPFELSDGKIVAQREKKGKDAISGDVAYATVADLYGHELAAKAVKLAGTKSRIRDVARIIRNRWNGDGKRPTLKQLETEMFEAIEKAGGVKKGGTYRTVEAHRKKADPALKIVGGG